MLKVGRASSRSDISERRPSSRKARQLTAGVPRGAGSAARGPEAEEVPVLGDPRTSPPCAARSTPAWASRTTSSSTQFSVRSCLVRPTTRSAEETEGGKTTDIKIVAECKESSSRSSRSIRSRRQATSRRTSATRGIQHGPRADDAREAPELEGDGPAAEAHEHVLHDLLRDDGPARHPRARFGVMIFIWGC